MPARLALAKPYTYLAQESVNAMSPRSAALQQIIDDFDLLEGWEDRYAYLIDLAGHMPPMPEELKIPEHLVKGCMSQVWMVPVRTENGVFRFLADSDAILVRGLIAILYAAYDGQPPEDVRVLDIEAVFAQLGLEQNLSPNRRNGFFSMVQSIQKLA